MCCNSAQLDGDQWCGTCCCAKAGSILARVSPAQSAVFLRLRVTEIFEIIGRWLIVFAFGCLVGGIYHIPRLKRFLLIHRVSNNKLGWREILVFFVVPAMFIGIFWALSCSEIVGEIYDIWASLSSHKWLADTGAVCWLIAHIIAHWICYLIGLLVSMKISQKNND